MCESECTPVRISGPLTLATFIDFWLTWYFLAVAIYVWWHERSAPTRKAQVTSPTHRASASPDYGIGPVRIISYMCLLGLLFSTPRWVLDVLFRAINDDISCQIANPSETVPIWSCVFFLFTLALFAGNRVRLRHRAAFVDDLCLKPDDRVMVFGVYRGVFFSEVLRRITDGDGHALGVDNFNPASRKRRLLKAWVYENCAREGLDLQRMTLRHAMVRATPHKLLFDFPPELSGDQHNLYDVIFVPFFASQEVLKAGRPEKDVLRARAAAIMKRLHQLLKPGGRIYSTDVKWNAELTLTAMYDAGLAGAHIVDNTYWLSLFPNRLVAAMKSPGFAPSMTGLDSMPEHIDGIDISGAARDDNDDFFRDEYLQHHGSDDGSRRQSVQTPVEVADSFGDDEGASLLSMVEGEPPEEAFELDEAEAEALLHPSDSDRPSRPSTSASESAPLLHPKFRQFRLRVRIATGITFLAIMAFFVWCTQYYWCDLLTPSDIPWSNQLSTLFISFMLFLPLVGYFTQERLAMTCNDPNITGAAVTVAFVRLIVDTVLGLVFFNLVFWLPSFVLDVSFHDSFSEDTLSALNTVLNIAIFWGAAKLAPKIDRWWQDRKHAEMKRLKAAKGKGKRHRSRKSYSDGSDRDVPLLLSVHSEDV